MVAPQIIICVLHGEFFKFLVDAAFDFYFNAALTDQNVPVTINI